MHSTRSNSFSIFNQITKKVPKKVKDFRKERLNSLATIKKGDYQFRQDNENPQEINACHKKESDKNSQDQIEVNIERNPEGKE